MSAARHSRTAARRATPGTLFARNLRRRRSRCRWRGTRHTIVRTYFACRHSLVTPVQKKSPTFTLHLDFLARFPCLGIVTSQRFVTHHVLPVVPQEGDVINGLAIEDGNAPFPVIYAALRMLLNRQDLRRLQTLFSRSRYEGSR